MTKSVAYRAEVINESGYVVMYPNLGDLADMKATYCCRHRVLHGVSNT